jgi:hypothetical protein
MKCLRRGSFVEIIRLQLNSVLVVQYKGRQALAAETARSGTIEWKLFAVSTWSEEETEIRRRKPPVPVRNLIRRATEAESRNASAL